MAVNVTSVFRLIRSMEPLMRASDAGRAILMTATAMMMLVDEGKVNLDDPVEKYLPEFKGQMVIAEKDADHLLLKKADHPFTVREILSHTAGLSFSSALDRSRYCASSPLKGVAISMKDSSYCKGISKILDQDLELVQSGSSSGEIGR